MSGWTKYYGSGLGGALGMGGIGANVGSLIAAGGGPYGLAAGAALGLLGGILSGNEEEEARQAANMVEAAKMRYSPWTGIAGSGEVKQPRGQAGQLISGLALGADQYQKYQEREALRKKLNGDNTSGWSGLPTPQGGPYTQGMLMTNGLK